MKQSKKHGAYAIDSKGITHYMGIFEDEGTVSYFKTFGAKKYASETNGIISVTIAGVNKKKGAEELKRKGGLKVLEEDFIFFDGGGMEAIYNDHLNDSKNISIDGHTLKLTSNVCLKPSQYSLGLEDNYKFLLYELEKEKNGRKN